MWSRVPETTLPPSYPGRANFSSVSLKSSTNLYMTITSGKQDNSWEGGGGVSPRQAG